MPDEQLTVSLRDYIDTRIKNVESQIKSLSEFNAQHFYLNEEAIKKSEQAMTVRLEGMNEFREQINKERSDYVTKETLNVIVENRETKFGIVNKRLEKLEITNAFSAGKMWVVMAAFAIVPTIIALISLFGK